MNFDLILQTGRAVLTGRYTLSIMLGVGITSGLLYIMQYAIQSEGVEVDETEPGGLLTFVGTVEDEEIIVPPRITEPPPPVEAAPDTLLPPVSDQTGGWTTSPMQNEYEGPESHGEIGVAAGDLLPIMTMPQSIPNA